MLYNQQKLITKTTTTAQKVSEINLTYDNMPANLSAIKLSLSSHEVNWEHLTAEMFLCSCSGLKILGTKFFLHFPYSLKIFFQFVKRDKILSVALVQNAGELYMFMHGNSTCMWAGVKICIKCVSHLLMHIKVSDIMCILHQVHEYQQECYHASSNMQGMKIW